MNSRAEAGLAASLALVKISVETVKKTDKNFAKVQVSGVSPYAQGFPW